MLVGMSAALVQGVPGSTLDTDIWVDLPARSYMKVINHAVRLGGQARSPNLVEFPDESRVDFLYSISGLNSFAREYAGANYCEWNGLSVAVLPLERIYHCKSVIRRPKDLLHMELIQTRLRSLEELKRADLPPVKRGKPSPRGKG